jgi:hypothetical protein
MSKRVKLASSILRCLESQNASSETMAVVRRSESCERDSRSQAPSAETRRKGETNLLSRCDTYLGPLTVVQAIFRQAI